MKKIYFVRHGETDANLLDYVPGKSEPLNQHGFLQADKLAERIENISVDFFVVSEYTRAQQTIAPVIKKNNLPLHIDTSFGEIFEPTSLHGLSGSDDRVKEHRIQRNSNVANNDWRMEDGENFHDVFKRIKAARLFLESQESQKILVTSHSFFISLFTAAMLISADSPTDEWFNLAKKIHISNTGITLWMVDDEHQWNLITWNDHAHFADN